MENTINYYNINAEEFVNGTVNADFSAICDEFLTYIQSNGHILDFGCGSGRDTKYFLDKGFLVTATDGSKKLCKAASEYAGIKVKNMFFEELGDIEKYDGIWACASILHVPKSQLKDILKKMIKATKKDGIIYTSFKYGDFEGMIKGRYFTFLTEEAFLELTQDIEEFAIEKMWITNDVRKDREMEQWLNLILRKI